MKRDEFLKEVREQAGLQTSAEAEKAVKAVLETMREHMAGREPHHLAAQLPDAIGQFLSPIENADARGERFSLEEFYGRVQNRAEVDAPQAEHLAKVVVAVLCMAVSEGEMRDVRVHFSRDYEPLFAALVRE